MASSETAKVSVGHGLCSTKTIHVTNTRAWRYTNFIDPANAVIPNAKITVTNIDTGVSRTIATDGAGIFRFFVLPPANYELKIEASGFGIYTRRPIQVMIGQTVIVDPQLQPASIQQEVVVQEEVQLVEPEKTQQ